MTVEDAVWAQWERVEHLRKPAIGLLLVSRTPRQRVLAAVRETIDDAMGQRAAAWADLPDEVDPPWTGDYGAMLARGGVAVEIFEGPDDFRGLMALIVAGLQQRGIAGHLELLAARSAPELPEEVALVECRMRVLGHREEPGVMARWRADERALWEVLRAGAAWCLQLPPVRGVGLQIGAGVRALIDPADLDELLADAVREADVHSFRLVCAGAGRYRLLSVRPWEGRVSLAELGDDVGWQGPVDSLRAFVIEQASHLVYAFIKPGVIPVHVSIGYSLATDWPPRHGFDRSLPTSAAYEDQWAPDAFGIQLVGAGYHDRQPTGPAWQHTPLAGDRTLIEHHDLAAWFARPGAADQTAAQHPPAPLATARRDFADILYLDYIGNPSIPDPGDR